MTSIKAVEFILFVKNQEESKCFYEKLFRIAPVLHVPGMTEFILSDHCKLGLMPSDGIAKILSTSTPHPNIANGIPRCELYLNVEDASYEFQHAVDIGATIISPAEWRDWNEKVGYLADLDGHIIAFAEKPSSHPK